MLTRDMDEYRSEFGIAPCGGTGMGCQLPPAALRQNDSRLASDEGTDIQAVVPSEESLRCSRCMEQARIDTPYRCCTAWVARLDKSSSHVNAGFTVIDASERVQSTQKDYGQATHVALSMGTTLTRL